jgi:predicted HD superfamily hydrolase involved in NAD metabolism
LSFSQLARGVRSHLRQDRRYWHCVRVARCADILAQRHRLDTGKARTAGMLHDLARLYSPARLMAECSARDMPIEEFERANPMLLHARLGAALARENFGIQDSQVLSAIEKHTTGAAEMSPLDCAVYVADSLEPHRSFVERGELWKLAMRDLAAATRGVILHSIRYHVSLGRAIAPPAAAAARAFGLDIREIEEVCASAN